MQTHLKKACMTKDEAHMYAARLTRVWSPQLTFTTSRNKVRWYFLAPLWEGVQVEHAIFTEGGSCYWLTEGKEHFEFVSFYISRDRGRRRG